MKRKEICRSEEFCNTVWDIYEFFENLDKKYVLWLGPLDSFDGKDKKDLYYLDEVNIGTNGMYRGGYDRSGHEIPSYKEEWVELVLKHIKNGSLQESKYGIMVDALREEQETVEEILIRKRKIFKHSR